MKVGIIRCMQTEDYCPASTDFRVMREKQGAFADIRINRYQLLRRLPRQEGCSKGKGDGEAGS